MSGSSWHGVARVSDASLCSLPCPSTLPEALVACGAVRGRRLVWWHARVAVVSHARVVVVCEGRVARSLRAGRRARRESGGRPSVVLLEFVKLWWGQREGCRGWRTESPAFSTPSEHLGHGITPSPPRSSRMRTLRRAHVS